MTRVKSKRARIGAWYWANLPAPAGDGPRSRQGELELAEPAHVLLLACAGDRVRVRAAGVPPGFPFPRELELDRACLVGQASAPSFREVD